MPTARINCAMVDNSQIPMQTSTRTPVDFFRLEDTAAMAVTMNTCKMPPTAPPIRKKKSIACRTIKTHAQPGILAGIYSSPVAQSRPS